MKPTSVIPPAVALILAGSWIVPQRLSMAVAESECVRLRTTLAAASPQASSANSRSHDPLEKRRKVIEWTKLAAHFPSNPLMSSQISFGAQLDPRVSMRFGQRMDAMSADEIIATLDEIAALDLPAEAHENLEWTLLNALTLKDPEMALNRFVDRAEKEFFLFRDLLSGALRAWAAKDTEAAVAWLDQQLAAGKFKRTRLHGDYSRLASESVLISSLLVSSTEAAARRLTALPEDQRRSVLQMNSISVFSGDELLDTYVDLIRAHVPAKDQADMIGSKAGQFFKPGDYSAVTAYLERIDATPDERAAFALSATECMYPKHFSSYLDREPIDGLREWVASQLPDMQDRVMGKVLSQAAWGKRKMEFAAAAELAVEYGAASGTGELLATFLTSQTARENKAAARALAGSISDDARRAEILTFLK